jgi:uncharacterized membrane protein (DUF485 family)
MRNRSKWNFSEAYFLLQQPLPIASQKACAQLFDPHYPDAFHSTPSHAKERNTTMAEHGPAVKLKKDKASPAKARLGIKLFVIYALVYAGFVAINTINPALMERPMPFGLNLAVFYGFGLIISAIIMGIIYNAICTRYENEMNKEEDQ